MTTRRQILQSLAHAGLVFRLAAPGVRQKHEPARAALKIVAGFAHTPVVEAE